MKEKIFGGPNKSTGNVWVYNGKTGDKVDAPFNCVLSDRTGDDIILYYGKNSCEFYIKLTNVNPIGYDWDEGDSLGEATDNHIHLSVSHNKAMSSLIDPSQLFDKKDICFTTKTTTTKPSTGGSGLSGSYKSADVTSKEKYSYDPYAMSALPFYFLQGGITAVGKKTGLFEEVQRIKNLMK